LLFNLDGPSTRVCHKELELLLDLDALVPLKIEHIVLVPEELALKIEVQDILVVFQYFVGFVQFVLLILHTHLLSLNGSANFSLVLLGFQVTTSFYQYFRLLLVVIDHLCAFGYFSSGSFLFDVG
jgi:hypothetical protein